MMKVKKSAAYWTVGLGAFAVAALLLCPPDLWTKVAGVGKSGHIIAANHYRSWTSRSNGNVILVADASMTRPQPQRSGQKNTKQKNTKPPSCLRWHKVQRGQTQWFLATAYNNRKNKQEWLRGMRWISGKRTNDASLKVGESVCVRWARRV